MKYHIIGSRGYIAQKLLNKIKNDNIANNIVLYSNNNSDYEVGLDLLDEKTFDTSRINDGDYVVFLAAVSSPDMCEHQENLARRVNVNGTKKFIYQCIEKGANVLFFSSDIVNGYTEDVNDEESKVFPFGKYGLMKYEIENEFMGHRQFKVFRLSYVFSQDDKFMKYLISCNKEHKVAEVFDALYRNVVYLKDVLDAIVLLSSTFRSWSNTIFNLSGNELLSRKDLAEIYNNNIDKDLRYVIVKPPTGFFAARPNYICSKSKYTESLLKRQFTNIKDAMINEFK